MSAPIFKDRIQAGQRLAAALDGYGAREDVVVLGLPRGGVPVAYEIAQRLHIPLDVLVVRKLGIPGLEELAMGAIASGGIRVLNESVIHANHVSDKALQNVVDKETLELHRRETAWRGHGTAIPVRNKTVILVDDGMATGSTMQAAVEALRPQHPRRMVVAVPAASRQACSLLRPMVDELVALVIPREFRAVGRWYEDFSQTEDAEVSRLLQTARHAVVA